MTEELETVHAIRRALGELPDVAAKEDLEPPNLKELYVPEGHTRALGLDATVVAGMRGAGKSMWTAALFDHHTRTALANAGAPKILEHTHVRVGYSVDVNRGGHPSPDVLHKLLKDGQEPRNIWRGVLARHLSDVCGLHFSFGDSAEDAGWWATNDPEGFDKLLAQGSRVLRDARQNLLVVFDSLDTLPGQWEMVRPLARGALEVALACRPYTNIRFKFFMRPDMEGDPEILNFRDSSKLLHSRVDLAWRPVDLYGLIFHILANGSAGQDFRKKSGEIAHVPWVETENIYHVPDTLRHSEGEQRRLVEFLGGPYMGTNPRRGRTYSWILTHLGDAHGRVAPRSLLLALRMAAEMSSERFSHHSHPLHYEAIKRGIAEASQRRVHELSREDYPWVGPLLNALSSMTVPLDQQDLRSRWQGSVLSEVMTESAGKLPPRRYSSAPPDVRNIDLLIDDLEELGVVYRTEDKRINIPDIFRIGFKIRRKGGVRPPARSGRFG